MSINQISIMLASENFLHVREDVNRARHLIRKSAIALNCEPEELLEIVKEKPMTLFGIDSFPL